MTALVITLPADARGDAERGKAKSQPCQACHGTDGNSESAAFPRLAGQHADYIAEALAQYADGRRQNAIMQGFATPLSKQDRMDLGAFYASQEGLKTLDIQR